MLLLSCLVIFVLTILVLRWKIRRARKANTIGIFHLYCSSGGGGERVLWHTVKLFLERHPKYTIYIYTYKGQHGDDPLRILVKARDLFKIDLMTDPQTVERLEFIQLSFSPLVDSKRYPFLTLFLQNLMSILVALQAAYYLIPEVYIETIGFTFTLPVFKLLNCTVITYIHYPIISNDMIHNVQTSSHASFNNREIFVKSSFLRRLKLSYYKLLVCLYGFAGRRADLVMVNSNWTRNHIESLWQTKAHVVYPPCDVDSFKSLPLNRFDNRPKDCLNVISIAQFRPEKNHELQIEAFDSFINQSQLPNSSRLTLYGGCRDAEDQKRVNYLRDLIHRLDLGARVEIVVNASFEELLEGCRKADVAIHTMANEHFGIVLLEFMAASLITVAHKSGGPKADIIEDSRDGFLADDGEDFAQKLKLISEMDSKRRRAIRESARRKSDQFSVQVFESSLVRLVDKFFANDKNK